MRYFLTKIWNPEIFQGHGKSSNYFEGWYFKIIDPTEKHRFAIIPGISFPKEGEPHAFIQVMNATACTSEYHRFPVSDFHASRENFSVTIGNNTFRENYLSVNLPEIQGELHFDDLVRWESPWYAPGIMGPFSFLPFMECYHGIVSLHHSISGTLRYNHEPMNFNQGTGYIEKDWGRSFPSSWIWMQSNHFDQPEMSLTASVAKIPYMGISFIGFIVGFWWKKKLYKFTTYTGAKLEHVTLSKENIHYTISDKYHRLEIMGHRTEGAELISPVNGKMEGKLNESIIAHAQVTFSEVGGKVLYKGEAINMGLEAGGKVEELIIL